MRSGMLPSVRVWRSTVALLALALTVSVVRAEPVKVRYPEGTLHGFLSLRTLDGRAIADGDLTQVVQGSQVTARLVFHFRDGSIHDETTVFSQQGSFQLVRDRLVQRGPSFPRPLEMTIEAAEGRVVVAYTDDDGRQQRATEQMDLPPDLANGLVLILLKNVSPEAAPDSFSFLAATPKPRLVRLKIAPAGRDSFATGRQRREAAHYVLEIELGGITGLIAPLVGKQPPDSHVWVLEGEAPAFVRADQPLYAGGPVWRIELVSPEWERPGGPRASRFGGR